MQTKPKSSAEVTKDEGRFEAKWGRTIAAAGFTQIPNALILNQRRLGLSHLDVCIILVIAQYWRPGKPCWISKKQLALATGVAPRSVQRRIKTLHDASLLRREERKHRSGDSDTNLYHLDPLIKRLERYAKEVIEKKKKRLEEREASRPGVRPTSLRVVKS